MIEIKLSDLNELLLKKRKKQIDIHKYSGVGEFVSGLTLLLSAFTSEYDSISFMPPIYLKCIIFVMAVILCFWGIYQFICSWKNHFDADILYKEIESLGKEHTFDIVLLENNQNEGKYLVFNNPRWKGWLFPNFPVTDHTLNMTENISCITRLLKKRLFGDENYPIDIDIVYHGKSNDIRCLKYSYGDKQYKIYRFRIFEVVTPIPEEVQRKTNNNGQDFKWMTMKEMQNDRAFMKLNSHVYKHILRLLRRN